METRLILAYGLLTVMTVSAAAFGMVYRKRSIARQRRLRGIKSYTSTN